MGTIADKLAYTKQARTEIQSAIVAKGVACPSAAPFCSFDDYIQQISGSGGASLEYITENLVCKVDSKDLPTYAGTDSFIRTDVTYRNGALVFNGNTSWINCGRYDLTQGTIEALVTFHILNDVTSDSHYVLGNLQGGGYGMCQYNKCNGATFNVGGTYYFVKGSVIIPYKVVHIAATFDGSSIKFYENGKLVDTITVSGSIKAPTGNTVLSIGSNPNGSAIGGQQLNGKVYAARIYSKALTAEQVLHNYTVDKARFTGDEFDENLIIGYNGAYDDSSPVSYTIDVGQPISEIIIKSPGALGESGLWMKGTVLCEASFSEGEAFTELFTDTASSEGVWGGTTNGNMSYNRKYSFDAPTHVHQIRLTFTTVYRVSCGVRIKA